MTPPTQPEPVPGAIKFMRVFVIFFGVAVFGTCAYLGGQEIRRESRQSVWCRAHGMDVLNTRSGVYCYSRATRLMQVPPELK